MERFSDIRRKRPSLEEGKGVSRTGIVRRHSSRANARQRPCRNFNFIYISSASDLGVSRSGRPRPPCLILIPRADTVGVGLMGTGDNTMSLIEEASGAATAAERRDEPPKRIGGAISDLMMVIVAIGIVVITLGWVALLVRGAVWLVRG